MNTITPIPTTFSSYYKEIPQVRLSQKITDLMGKKDISEPYLNHFLRKYRKGIAIFAIKNPYFWQELVSCMRQRLNKNSRISKLLKNLRPPTFSQIFPRELRNSFALSMPPSGYRNTVTLQKMRLLFLGDLPPLIPTLNLDDIPIKTLGLWIEQNRVPLQTLLKTRNELEDLVPELKYVDLTRFTLDNHYSMLEKVYKVRDLTIQFLSEREFNLLNSLEELESLTFQTCGILDADRKYIKELTQLKSLSFITCYHISDSMLNILKHLTGLTSLTISQCGQITNNGIRHISTLSSLTHLNLSYCTDITDEGLLNLKDLPLKKLDITYCHKITNSGLKPFALTKISAKHCHKIT